LRVSVNWQILWNAVYSFIVFLCRFDGLSAEHFLVSLQVLQNLNVFDEGDLDAAAEALDDVIFFIEFSVAVQS
jgi:hypothetical protein